MYDLGISYTFHFHIKNVESSVIYFYGMMLRKENKEASAICFEIRIPKKKNKKLLWKVPSKIFEVIFSGKKMKKEIGLLIFPNIITEQWGYCVAFLHFNLKSLGTVFLHMFWRVGPQSKLNHLCIIQYVNKC